MFIFQKQSTKKKTIYIIRKLILFNRFKIEILMSTVTGTYCPLISLIKVSITTLHKVLLVVYTPNFYDTDHHHNIVTVRII